jgi:hypothetical protein
LFVLPTFTGQNALSQHRLGAIDVEIIGNSNF